jgi:surface protein
VLLLFAHALNDDISSWNVGSGITFESMFYECETFNSDVSGWNVANATNLSHIVIHFIRTFLVGMWPKPPT